MPQALVIGVFQYVAASVSVATLSWGLGTAAGLVAAGATIGATMWGLKKLSEHLAPDMPSFSNAGMGRLVTASPTDEAQPIVYGEVRKGGVLVLQEVSGLSNEYLWQVIAFAGHEIDSFQAIHFKDKPDINLSTDLDGNNDVTLADYVAADGTKLVRITTYTGTDTQAVDAGLSTALGNKWTSNHRGRGIAYAVIRIRVDDSEGGDDPDDPVPNVWSKGVPQNITATIRGKKIYDPRLDSTNGGSGSHRYTDSSTWEWSDNPILIIRDYMTDTRLGMGEDNANINDTEVATQASICEEAVTVWDGAGGSTTQERYRASGIASTASSPARIIQDVLSSCGGAVGWTEGAFKILAGAYDTPTQTIDESWLRGAVTVQATAPRRDRYNFVRGRFIDPANQDTLHEYESRTDATYQTQDGGVQLEKTLDLPFTSNEYQAQRLALIALKKSRNQQTVTLKCNLKAMRVALYEVVNVTIDELGYSSKPMRVINWKVSADGGVDLVLVEESSSDWTYTYSTDLTEVSSPTSLDDIPEVPPAPSGLVATTVPGGVSLTWTNPDPRFFKHIEVYASATNVRPTATGSIVGKTTGDSFIHTFPAGQTRYYWIKARGLNNKASSWVGDATSSPEHSGGVSAVSGADYSLINLLQGVDTGVSTTTDSSTGAYPDAQAMWVRTEDIGVRPGDIISVAGVGSVSNVAASFDADFLVQFCSAYKGSVVSTAGADNPNGTTTPVTIKAEGIEVPATATWINILPSGGGGGHTATFYNWRIVLGRLSVPWVPPLIDKFDAHALVIDPWFVAPMYWELDGAEWVEDDGEIGGTIQYKDTGAGDTDVVWVRRRQGPQFLPPPAKDGDIIHFRFRAKTSSGTKTITLQLKTHDEDGGNAHTVTRDVTVQSTTYRQYQASLVVDNNGNTGPRYVTVGYKSVGTGSGPTVTMDQFTASTVGSSEFPVVDNYTELRKIAEPQEGDTVVLRDDGIAGEFVFDPAETTTDDSGIYITPNDGTTGRWVRRYYGARSCEWFGAVAGGSATTNASAIQAALDVGDGAVMLGAGQFEINNVISMPDNVEFYGVGYATQIKMASGGSDYSSQTVVQFGNYAGEAVTGGANDETGYSFTGASPGDYSFTLTTTSEDSNFSVGDVIFFESTATNSTGSPKYVHVSRVKSISSGTITMERPFFAAFENGATVRVETGTLTSNLDGENAATCKNSSIHDMRLSHADGQTAWQVIHLSPYECDFYNLFLEGGAVLSGNPVAYSTFRNIRGIGLRKIIESAYYSVGNVWENIRLSRPQGDAAGVDFGMDFNQSGGWSTIINCVADNGTSTSDAIRSTEQHGNRFINCRGIAGTGTSRAFRVENDSEGTEFLYCTAVMGEDHGISVDDADGTIIRGCTVEGDPFVASPEDPKYSIHLSSSATNTTVENNTLGDGSDAGHIVYDTKFAGGVGHKIRGNEGYTFDRSPVVTTTSHTGTTSATVLESVSRPVGTITAGSSIRVTAFGSVTGSNGNKTIEVKVGGSVVATADGITSWTAGEEWAIDVRVYFDASNSQEAGAWIYDEDSGATTKSVRFDRVGTSVNCATTACDVELVGTLTNASDTIVVRAFEVEVIQQ